MSKVKANYNKISITAPYEESVWQVINQRLGELFGTKKFEREYYSQDTICRELNLLLEQMHAKNIIIKFNRPRCEVNGEVYNFILDFSVANNQEEIPLEIELEVEENGV